MMFQISTELACIKCVNRLIVCPTSVTEIGSVESYRVARKRPNNVLTLREIPLPSINKERAGPKRKHAPYSVLSGFSHGHLKTILLKISSPLNVRNMTEEFMSVDLFPLTIPSSLVIAVPEIPAMLANEVSSTCGITILHDQA